MPEPSLIRATNSKKIKAVPKNRDKLVRRKICFIIPSLKVGGGSERVIVELANYCAENTPLESHLIILARTDKFYSVSSSVIIHEPDFDYKKHSRIVFTFKLMHFLRKTVKAIQPAAILSFEEMYSSFVLLATLFLGHHVFVSDRSKPDKDWGFIQNNLRRFLYRYASGIISQTLYSKRFLEKETRNKNIEVIENPIKQITPRIGAFKENIILNVGRLIKSKKQDLLIEMFSKCPNPSWKLVILGSGPEKENLKLLIENLQLQGRVVLQEAVTNVEHFYNTSKIFAFTSISEGYPNTLGEAMSAGLACISFDCIAGPSDLIDDGKNGFLIEEGNIKKYIEKLTLLMQDADLQKRLGSAARNKVGSLTIDNIATKYLKFMFNEI